MYLLYNHLTVYLVQLGKNNWSLIQQSCNKSYLHDSYYVQVWFGFTVIPQSAVYGAAEVYCIILCLCCFACMLTCGYWNSSLYNAVQFNCTSKISLQIKRTFSFVFPNCSSKSMLQISKKMVWKKWLWISDHDLMNYNTYLVASVNWSRDTSWQLLTKAPKIMQCQTSAGYL